MRVDPRLFRSKLAHRVFLAFALCALVPILIVGVLSYRSVGDQLVRQAAMRLTSASKGLGLSLYERLLFAETELLTVIDVAGPSPSAGNVKPRTARFNELRIVPSDGVVLAPEPGRNGSSFERRQVETHLAQGGTMLLPGPAGTDAAPVTLAVRLKPEDPSSDLAVGEIDPAYLWGLDGGNSIPAGAEFCVFDQGGRLVHETFGGCADAWKALGESGGVRDEHGIPNAFSVGSPESEIFIAGRWDLFLKARFMVSSWVIVVCEPKRSVVLPIARWRVVFPAVVTLAFWVVLLLIIGAIRKNLDPIDRLREATVHVADGDFDFKVDVETGDEFEELADSFNRMSARLRRQFGALAATGRIHRAILSSVETSQVVDETVRGLLDFFDCSRASIIVADPKADRPGHTTATRGRPFLDFFSVQVDLDSVLGPVWPGAILGRDAVVPPELVALFRMEAMAVTYAVPIVVRGNVVAVIGMGFEASKDLSPDDLTQLTQIADQFAVAHANASMLQEVNDFSVGILEALARAIDAKSPWTAGHSERVTHLAVTIGEALGLAGADVFRLYRGSMLHDIGKLGISQAVLDKKIPLTDDEFELVRAHTTIGERILEPIGAFSEIMPVVTQHHERFNGSGYPLGLSGSDIDIKARVVAVADVFDAMTNRRPYRDQADPAEVLEMIREQSGAQFDPDVVVAFERVIDSLGGIEHVAALRRDFSSLPWLSQMYGRLWDEGGTEGER